MKKLHYTYILIEWRRRMDCLFSKRYFLLKSRFLSFFLAAGFVVLIGQLGYSQDQLGSIPNSDPSYQKSTLKPAPGLEVNLFASEPMLEKPIQMNWDERGRLWVVGSKQYPQPKPGEKPDGKVYILEDTDGDGQADTSIVFAEGLQVPTAILPGDGGAYVANSTEIIFLKDTNGDGKADVQKTMLSGFGTGDTHHLLHTFRWGPDGAMYFNQAVYIYSHIETPWGPRRLEGGGVWRFKPATLELEVFVRGLWNPWGLRFNEYGQTFLTDGAGSEGINYGFPDVVFQATPGAERIIHGLNPGKPKMTGVDFLKSSHLPVEFGNSLVTNDFRANRINRYELEEMGSGYSAKQVEDLLYTDNVAFRPVDVSIGPDGAIYIADWYNPIIQHGEVDFRDPRRDHVHGRIWRITAQDRPLVSIPNLVNLSNSELLETLKLPEAWPRNQARRLLRERGVASVLPDLKQWLSSLNKQDQEYERLLLEALWIHQSLDVANIDLVEKLLLAEEHKVRAAAVRVLHLESTQYPEAFEILKKAVKDVHPMVRLEAVVALKKHHFPESSKMALSVLDNEMDENLDFALWQTIQALESDWMPTVMKNPEYFEEDSKSVFAFKSVKHPFAISELTTRFVQDRVDSIDQAQVLQVIGKYGSVAEMNVMLQMALKSRTEKEKYLDVLIAASNQQGIAPNRGLDRFVELISEADNKVLNKAIQLIGLWEMKEYLPNLQTFVQSDNTDVQASALSALALMEDEESRGSLRAYTDSPYDVSIRQKAIGLWTRVDINESAEMAANLFKDLKEGESPFELMNSFFSTKGGLTAMVDNWSDEQIPEIVARLGVEKIGRMNQRRQEDTEVQQLVKLFESSGVKLPQATMPQKLSPGAAGRLELDVKSNADPVKGELVYRKLGCMSCHAIGGAGGKIGTDLSSIGANAPTDYIIGSLLDPGAEIKDGYELNKVVKKNGTVIQGYLVRKTDSEVVLRTISGGQQSIPTYQIDSHENIEGSLMPPGLTAGLQREEFVDLVGFLSKIGEPGEFRISNNRMVRNWAGAYISSSVSLAGKESLLKVLKEDKEIDWLPAYSKVSGQLPLAEVNTLSVQGNSYRLVKYSVKVDQAGLFNFKMEANGIEILYNQEKVKLNSFGYSLNLNQGIHQVFVLIDVKTNNQESLEIELLDTGDGKGQLVEP